MMLPIALTLMAVVVVLGLVAVLYFYSIKANTDLPEAEWLQSFSPTRYRPMLRILNNVDDQWLSSQGVPADEIRKLRAERREVFDSYFSNLVRDFYRLHKAALSLMLTSPFDEPELAQRLIRVRIDFQRTVISVRLGLLLQNVGIGTVNLQSMVEGIETVHRDLKLLLPSQYKTAGI